ncbi:hypothetical protein Sinac_4551 [Singulisphaera acidiphila DSM 18658]|uniref:Uncharacterized protein n=1 Tax=Singulisphaera acidiphila (strain ATCC BAA-1392 / DSM 18658 / VKM B-2454 / MOB10) TaxID=886293 RepID=L0DHJ8_SINAD|nr:hypothetical protein Sinac_4551 [Singulisphaera acidiphila DSM 18658]
MGTRYVRYWAAGALACFVSGFLSAAFLDWLHGPTLPGGAQAASAASNPWIQFFGTLCGALVGGSFLLVGQHVSWKSQHELKTKEINEQRKRQRADLQMKTLVDLQETLFQLSNSASLINARNYAEFVTGSGRRDALSLTFAVLGYKCGEPPWCNEGYAQSPSSHTRRPP